MPGHGTFMWNELATTDPEACKAFYEKLLGWTAEEMPMPDMSGVYTVFKADGVEAAGMLKMDGEQFAGIPPHWLSYIQVDDVDAAVAQAQELGGSVKTPAIDVPGVGRFAVIADPSGAVVALMTPSDEMCPEDAG